MITKRAIEAPQGWVFYDGDCPLCTRAITRFGPLLHRHHFDLAPLQATWVQKRLGLKPGAPLVEMKLLADNGQIYGGVDAYSVLFRAVWWLWPLGYLLIVPGIHWLAGCIYRWVARHRNCFGGRCEKGDQGSICHRHAAFFDLP